MRWIIRIVPAIVLLALLASLTRTTAAQDSSVVAVTQDFAALRAGPGLAFERLAVVPPGTTLPVVGRTVTTHWLQVEYEGQRGWIAGRLLIWTGDAFSLPVDGVEPVPFARRTVSTATVFTDAAYYPSPAPLPETRLGTLPAGTRIELIARYGSGELVWVQFQRDDGAFWVGSWNVVMEDFNLFDLPDAAAIFPYGRLLGSIRVGLRRSQESFRDIRSIWTLLADGRGVSCNTIPPLVRPVDLRLDDLEKEPLLAPAARAAADGIENVNAAIALFEAACASTDRVIPYATLQTALGHLAAAERAFTLASVLFDPLTQRDPASGG